MQAEATREFGGSLVLARLRRHPYIKPLGSIAGIVAIIIAANLYGAWHAASAIDPAVFAALDRSPTVSLVVRLGFAPEQYNLLFLHGEGELARFTGDRVYLNHVTRAGVQEIGAQYWVQSVALAPKQ